MRRTRSRFTVLAAATLLLAAASAFSQAPSLRIDDVFSTTTATQLAPDAGIDDRIAALSSMLAAERWQEAAGESERLLRIVQAADSRLPEVLWLRARALKATGADAAALDGLRTTYLRVAPNGPRRAWFFEHSARALQTEMRWREAADAWLLCLDASAQTPPPGALLLAMEALGRSGRPRELRRVAALLPPSLAFEENLAAQYWLLESLLVLDDASVPIGALQDDSVPPGIRLRRALVLELRGDSARARDEYGALMDASRSRLDDAERGLLDRRIEALRTERPWPPKPKTARPNAAPPPARPGG